MPLDLLLPLATADAAGAAEAAEGVVSAADALRNVASFEYAPYTSWLKAIPFVVVLFVAAKLAAWADKDAEHVRLPREITGLMSVSGLAAACLAFFLLPNFLIAFGAFVLILLATAGAYLGWRNSKAGLSDLPEELGAYFKSFGGKKKPGRAKADDGPTEAGEVQLTAADGTVLRLPPPEDPARETYVAAQQALAGPLIKGGDRVELVPGSNGSQVRYQVDGVTYPGPSFRPEQAATLVAYLKKIIGVDPTEKRKPQAGKLAAKFGGAKHKLLARTSGSTKGERLVFEVDPEARYAKRVADLGFRKSQLAAIQESVGRGSGVVLVAMPEGQGLHTTLYALLREHDAFLQHIQTLEVKKASPLEGITQNELQAGDDEAERVDWLTSQLPDVLMVEKVDKPQSAKLLCQYAKQKRVYVGVRAANAFDAIVRWRKLVGDDKLALATLDSALSGRVFRRLCPSTKQAFTPDARTLKAMGLPADKRVTLYKAHVGPIRDEKGNEIPDPFCHNLGYKGRIGAYELVTVDDAMRDAMRSGAGGQQIKSLFRKAGGRYIQEMALGVVQVGETDLKEVQRVMEGKDKKPAGSSPAAKPAQPATAS